MGKLLWQPSEQRIKDSNAYRFINLINEKYNKSLADFTDLWEWSTENIPDFWASMWEFSEIKASQPYKEVVDDLNKMPGAKWFSGAKLNFAENLLRYRDDRVALTFKGEAQESTKMTYAELYDEVARVAKSLSDMGVQSGDRVVGFMPNMPQAMIAMLAATSLGAAWSSCSPDFGIKGVLDRPQLEIVHKLVTDGRFADGSRSAGMAARLIETEPAIIRDKYTTVPST